MKKLTLATVALWTLFGVADIVSAQSDPDPVEPDTLEDAGTATLGTRLPRHMISEMWRLGLQIIAQVSQVTK